LSESNFDVCKQNVENYYRYEEQKYTNFLHQLSSNFIYMYNGDDPEFTKGLIQNYKTITLENDDEKFIIRYIYVLAKFYEYHETFRNEDYKEFHENKELYNSNIRILNHVITVLMQVVKEVGGFKRCETFRIILLENEFMKKIYDDNYKPLKTIKWED